MENEPEIKYGPESSPKLESKEEPEDDQMNEIDMHSLSDTKSKKQARALFERVIHQLIDCEFIKDTFAFGDTKFNVILNLFYI